MQVHKIHGHLLDSGPNTADDKGCPLDFHLLERKHDCHVKGSLDLVEETDVQK